MGDDDIRHQWPTPTWWKKLAKQAFAEGPRGLKADAARELGITASAITQMLAPRARQSRHALALADFLGIPRPSLPAGEDLSEWDRVGRLLSPEQRAAVLRMLEATGSKAD